MFILFIIHLLLIVLSIYLMYYLFSYYFVIFITLNIIITGVTVLSILSKKVNPTYKISWLVSFIMFPVVGVIMYILTHLQLGSKSLMKKLKSIENRTKNLLNTDYQVDYELRPLSNYFYNTGSFPTYKDVETVYFPDGDLFFKDLLSEVNKAKKTIFIDSYIISNGVMLKQLLEVLERKKSEHVVIKILYDGIGSLSFHLSNIPKRLKKMGIECVAYCPIKPLLSTYQNNRNHHKIFIIDNKIAYTGGINIADEYIHKKSKYGYWKDTAIKITGTSVITFMISFLKMWKLSGEIVSDNMLYLPDYDFSFKKGYVIPYTDSPYIMESLSKNVYLDILYQAKKYVHIMTPYLVLDYEMMNAIIMTAKKKIEIIIIVPSIPDKKMVHLVGKSYYEELLKAGVKIYEYTPGFCHAKVWVSDNKRAVVGSINLDYRSFYLQFESAVYLFKNTVIKDIENDFTTVIKDSRQITITEARNIPWYKKILGQLIKLFSSLL